MMRTVKSAALTVVAPAIDAATAAPATTERRHPRGLLLMTEGVSLSMTATPQTG
jgi:hypothetical protein